MAEELEFNMQAVESSQINAVGYNSAAQKMRIEFSKGAVYEYSNVPQEVYFTLVSAPSVGRYFAQAVKYSFAYERVE